MLTTKQKVLRRFWYATMPVDELEDGPKPFTLLGETIVLFLDAKGEPAALRGPLLPPHREALEGLVPRRQHRLRLSRLGIRPRPASW